MSQLTAILSSVQRMGLRGKTVKKTGKPILLNFLSGHPLQKFMEFAVESRKLGKNPTKTFLVQPFLPTL